MADYGRRVVDHADMARTRTSMVPRILAMPKGAGWGTSMMPRVSMMLVLSRVSMMSEGCSAAAKVLCVGGGHGAR